MKRRSIYAIVLSSVIGLSGCGNEVDCNIPDDHVHYYRTYSGIERLIEGEYEYLGEFQRYDEYELLDDTYRVIVDNSLCILDDNLEYVSARYDNRLEDKRYEITMELVPEHFGLVYDKSKEGMDALSYSLVPERYEQHLEEIPLDQYTKNPVIDVTYGILLYKIDDNGNLESKVFASLDDREDGYDYFKTGDLIAKITSPEYYLDKNMLKEKSYN